MNKRAEQEVEYCHANRDGDCFHKNCPQIRDGEPKKTGRHCPLDTRPEEDYGCCDAAFTRDALKSHMEALGIQTRHPEPNVTEYFNARAETLEAKVATLTAEKAELESLCSRIALDEHEPDKWPMEFNRFRPRTARELIAKRRGGAQ